MIADKCVKFESFLPEGTTRPFIGRSESGSCWVIKAPKDDSRMKIGFNEYVAGSMANAIQLPWPKVDLIELCEEVKKHLRKEGFALTSNYAVALEYIPGLKAVHWPKNGVSSAEHIMRLFPDLSKHSSFYGMAVFENWVLLKDEKYDTLQIDTNGDPMFLDASMAFSGLDWNKEQLRWEDTHIDFHLPYLEGILNEKSKFMPWLSEMQKMDDSSMGRIFENIPPEWRVPEDYLVKCQELLQRTKEEFLPLFSGWLRGRYDYA